MAATTSTASSPHPGAAPRGTPGATPSLSVSPAQLTIVVVCVVCVYFIIGFYGKSLESYRINQRADEVRREVAALDARNRDLQTKVAELSTDGYAETTARDKLGLVKPGDHSLIVLPEKPDVAWVAGPPPSTSTVRAFPEFGHLADWLAFFFAQPAR